MHEPTQIFCIYFHATGLTNHKLIVYHHVYNIYISFIYIILSYRQYWYIVYQNIKKVLNFVCDTFPHTCHLKPMYGAYCWSGNGLHFSKYNEEKSTFLCNYCDWDKKEAMVWFQPLKDISIIITYCS